MKSILIIGMGLFGRKLAADLSRRGDEVMIVDRDEDVINELSPRFTGAYIGDCTNEDVLRSLGVGNFDAVVVTVGGDFQSSLEITALVKELGALRVIAKADRDIQAKFLLRNGADEVVYPDRDMAQKLSLKLHARNIFDYVDLSQGYGIFEIAVPKSWVGRSLRESDIRRKHQINVLSIRDGNELLPVPDPDFVFTADDHVIIMGQEDVVLKLSNKG